MSRRCVFLDRDGVINVAAAPGEYITRWEQFQFLPNISDWIKLFNALGFLTIVVTNQRCVALGLTTGKEVQELHRRMIGELAKQGAHIDDVFCCIHEEGLCDCRKPRPGMILEAQAKWNIDLKYSLLIGDSPSDRQLAQACHIPYVGVRDGQIVEAVSKLSECPDAL